MVLAVRAASARYGATRALDNVDLDVAAGELCALLGPNAAGKTTALRVIIGRVPLEHGTIRVLGRDPVTDIDARTQIGLVPQEIALYGHLTVRENLEVFARLAGVAPRQVPDRIAAALAMCRLGTRANDQVRSLSGGCGPSPAVVRASRKKST